MNKIYPQQHYSVNELVFVEGDTPPPQAVPMAKQMMNNMTTMAIASPPLAVSNELILTAVVEAASNRHD